MEISAIVKNACVPYYPYIEDPLPDRPGHISVEGTYAFDWDRWDDGHWAELDRIYRGLPGWAGYHQAPYWFGSVESNPPWLSASVEPPGLQVAGRLRAEDWRPGTRLSSPVSSSSPAALEYV